MFQGAASNRDTTSDDRNILVEYCISKNGKMATGNCHLEQLLLSLPCHFTWEELEMGNVDRPVELNIDNMEEHIQQTIQGTEIESYNLMGFYKTQMKCFQEARQHFGKALEFTNTKDEKIVSLACLAWLTWKEETDSNCSSSRDEILAKINEVKEIFCGRQVDNIPEVMAEKAYSIANSGFDEKGFQEALVCIGKALKAKTVKPRNESPDKSIMLMFTRVFIMQRLYLHRKKHTDNDGKTKNKIQELWKEFIAMLKENSSSGLLDAKWRSVYGQAMIQYALFLSHIKRDFGTSGRKYAEEAEEVAGYSHAVMRGVANFYVKTAGNNKPKLKKAEEILTKIIESKPTEVAAYKELSLLGQILLKKFKFTSCEKIFVKAEECLHKAWNGNKKYVVVAFDLIRLYEARYDKNGDVSVLAKAEKIFGEIQVFLYFENQNSSNKAYINSMYANFLKDYGVALASYHHDSSRFGLKDECGKINKIEEASKLLKVYTEDRDDDKLLRVAEIFKNMYSNLEQMKDPVKTRFHQDYGDFLDKYSSDLAICHFVKSLKWNPNQRRENVHTPLGKLARKKTESSNREEQMKGHKILEWLEKIEKELNSESV